MLGCDVVCQVRHALQRCCRGNTNNFAAPPGKHERNTDLAGNPYTLQIDIHCLIPLLLAHLPACCKRVKAGVRNHDINRAEFALCSFDQFLHCPQVCHIHLCCNHPAPHLLKLGNECCQVFWQRQWLAGRAARIWTRLREKGGLSASAAAVTLLSFAVGMHFLLAMKPEVGTDSLAMHLALPAYVSIHHHWPYDVKEFIWALMPQTTDWCYTLAYSIGGDLAARLLNFTNLLAILGLLYSLLRTYCSHVVALLTCALYATGPLVQVVTGSLFIENLLAALLIASFLAFFRHALQGGTNLYIAGWLCLGLALSCKTGALAFVPGIVALSIWAGRRCPVPFRVWSISAASGLAIGAYIFFFAWLSTGNPVFPLANEIFHSKLFVTERIADQFRLPLSWRTLSDVTFHSGLYIEGSDGSAGFHYFLILPAALAVIVRRRYPAAVWSAAVGLSAFVITFCQISYLRYVYPALLLLMAPLALWLAE